jgi:hypothetical protein
MFSDFLIAFATSFAGTKPLFSQVLANVFSMRVLGNKTHGDLAEVALTEYINEHVEGYNARHTGKETFRQKVNEEDVRVTNDVTGESMPVSIKTYGIGPLQLSTNKTSTMFTYLSQVVGQGEITDPSKIQEILAYEAFADFDQVNVLPFIYDEKHHNFKIIVYDLAKAYSSVTAIRFKAPRKHGAKMTFPIYKFYGANDQYIFEVRYGGTGANALQRGMWTHTENASQFFRQFLSDTYQVNEPLLKLIAKLLIARPETHKDILERYFSQDHSAE